MFWELIFDKYKLDSSTCLSNYFTGVVTQLALRKSTTENGF